MSASWSIDAQIVHFVGDALASSHCEHHDKTMTKKTSLGGKAAIGAAIGSAAIAAALLYSSKKKQKNEPKQPGPIPSGEQPETD